MFKRTFARTIPDNVRALHMKMWGFEAKKARKFTRTLLRTLPCNFITMLSARLMNLSLFPRRSTTPTLEKQGRTLRWWDICHLVYPIRQAPTAALPSPLNTVIIRILRSFPQGQTKWPVNYNALGPPRPIFRVIRVATPFL